MMPEGRILKKKISRDKAVAQLSPLSALLFTWFIPHLDVKGRAEGAELAIKGTICPHYNPITVKKIPHLLKEMEKQDLICIYYRDGYKYLYFKGFEKNQRINIDREAPSEIPPPTPEELQSNSRVTLAKVNLSKVNLSKDNIREATPEFTHPPFVYIPNEELTPLISDFGNSVIKDYISRLNDYAAQFPDRFKKYKSHSATIRNWLRRDGVRKLPKPEPPKPLPIEESEDKRKEVRELVQKTLKELSR